MAKIKTTERERWALFMVMAPLNPQNRQERKRNDRLWDALGLDPVAEKVARYPSGSSLDPKLFNDEIAEAAEVELTSDQRDVLIDLLDKPALTQNGWRLLRRLDAELVRGRDGEANQDK